ncbi:MAG: 2-oxoglutarate dehydrogenase complex dihydrolipoyllysine-residue succinyltransferase [Bacteroidales bacterium]|nr:2-oxoglutarate dehydrogenase complex dihydrolipoyllysine-residue succinyltransferase [Bacteroidales bacterium]
MAVVQIKVPSPGESVTEGRIAQWLKPDGAVVKVDDPLFELESDKASLTVTAEQGGTLRINVAAGEVVAIGAIIGTIDTDAVPATPTAAPTAPAPSPATAPSPTGEGVASPAAQRVLAERGLSAADVPGTGPRGIVTKPDAAAFQPNATNGTSKPTPTAIPTPAVQPATVTPAGRETRQPMSMIRRRTAERLLESQNTTATLTTFNEADMSAIMALRAKYNDRFEKKHGMKLGFMSVFVKAAIAALKAFPMANARIDGSDIVMQHFYDIGVAVSSEKGLFVPVIRDADQLGFADIEKKIADLAKRARDGKIGVPDMMGGTFTITNGGVFGSLLSTPILNPPQTAILGMHTIQKRPVAVDDQVVIRPMMYLALSYDHRLIDGREAVQFLVRVKECVENPERMLLEI